MKIPAYASKILIGGEWRSATGGGVLALENPSTGQVIGEIASAQAADIDAAVTGAMLSAQNRNNWATNALRLAPKKSLKTLK